MANTFLVLFLIGLVLLAIANLFMRTKSAPPIGAGGFSWPWQAREKYTNLGYVLHLSGWLLFLVSGIVRGVIQFVR